MTRVYVEWNSKEVRLSLTQWPP